MKKFIQLLMVMTLFTWAQGMRSQCVVNAGPNHTICCVGGSATLGGSPTGTTSCAGGISYVWAPAASLSNPNSPNPVASPSSTTVYTVCMVSYNSANCGTVCCVACKTTTVTVVSTCCRMGSVGSTGKGHDSFTVYPNPARSEITVEAQEAVANGELVMTDATGKVVLTENISSDQPQTISIEVSMLPRGIYLVSLNARNEEVYSARVVLE